MPLQGGYIVDRGLQGERYIDKRLKMGTGLGGAGSASWLEPTGAAVFFDDFLLETAAAVTAAVWDTVAVQATGGTRYVTDTAAGTVAGINGWIRGTTGTGDNDTEGLFGELNWRADRAGNGILVYEARINMASVAGVGFALGLTDARTEAAAGIINNVAETYTTVPTNGTFLVFDTDATTDIINGIGVKADVDTAAVAGPAATVAPLASTSHVLRIELDVAGQSFFYIDGTGYGGTAASVTVTTPLCALVSHSARAASAAKGLDVDYVMVACAR